MPTGYPYPAPTVSGTKITMEAFLQNPARVQRTLEDLTLNRWLADYIFAPGPPATGGAVLFDQLLANDLFTDGDVQAIEPGAEFPLVNYGETMPGVATVTKWGGAALYTYEAVRRDRRDVLGKGLTQLRNTLVRKVDRVAMATLEAAVTAGTMPTQPASADWSSTGEIFADIAVAQSRIDNADMGYVADTVLLHPDQALDMRKSAAIRAMLPRENVAAGLINASPIGDRGFAGLFGIPNWFVSPRVTAGSAWVLAGKQVGSISDEMPLYSRTVDDEERERYRIMAARVVVPYVTDPLAAVKITGA